MRASAAPWIIADGYTFPMVLETRRMAPGMTNTWYIEVDGLKASARFSTRDPKSFFYLLSGDKEQPWCRLDSATPPRFRGSRGASSSSGSQIHFCRCGHHSFWSWTRESRGFSAASRRRRRDSLTPFLRPRWNPTRRRASSPSDRRRRRLPDQNRTSDIALRKWRMLTLPQGTTYDWR